MVVNSVRLGQGRKKKQWAATVNSAGIRARFVTTDSGWACGSKHAPLASCRRRPAVPSWVRTGPKQPPPWWSLCPPAAHLSDSPLRPLSACCCSWCWRAPCSPLRATRSRFIGTAWSCVSGRTALGLGCGASSPTSRSTWRWQVSRSWQVS